MKAIGQRTWHVTLSLPKQYGGKMSGGNSAGEQGNFVGQRFMNLGSGDEKLHNAV